MKMLEQVAGKLVNELGPEVFFTAISLEEKYGSVIDVEKYAELMGVKKSAVERQISDETIAIKPTKIGRANMFPIIDVAKLLHGENNAAA